MFKYIKKAFFFHWNLLAVCTGIVGGIISGRPDVAIPALAALEVIYLASLSSHPRFQDAVDAWEHEKNLIRSLPDQKLQNILSALSKEDKLRYERLKNLCLELRCIADRVKGNLEEELEIISDV